MAAKRFADDALDAIALDRFFADPARHRQPDAGMVQPVGGDMDIETRAVQPPFVIENRAELLAVHQPQATTETRRNGHRVGRLGQLRGRIQALRRTRRLARRALMTARPARVRIRSRKPWVRLRFSMLGWKVRFMVSIQSIKRRGNLPCLAEEFKSILIADNRHKSYQIFGNQ